MSLIPLLPLLGKRLEDLSLDDLNLVSKHLNINVDVTPDMHAFALKLVTDGDINSVADLIQSPTQVKKLVDFFKSQKDKPADERVLKQCPHCDNFFLTL